MPLRDFLDRLTLTRRLVKALDRQAEALEQMQRVLTRLADHLAPVISPPSEDDLRTTSASFHRDATLARYQAWYEGFWDRVGRTPSEEEIEEWLTEDAERTHS